MGRRHCFGNARERNVAHAAGEENFRRLAFYYGPIVPHHSEEHADGRRQWKSQVFTLIASV
jgi:hypothetical protein